MAKTIYERYLDARTDYLARERAAYEKTDQVLLAGAAGALALSVTFIEKIASTPLAATMWMLGSSWLSLLASLGAALVSYELRSQTFALARRTLDKAQDPDKMNMKLVDRCNGVLLGLKAVSLVTLLIGVVLLVLFAYRNVKTA